MEAIGKLTRLTLGRVGEYNSRTIQIDVSEWEELFPGCAIGVLVFPPADDGFPQTSTCHLAATEVLNNVLTWTIASQDVAKAGEGFVEIRCIGYDTGASIENDTVVTSVRISKTVPTITYTTTAEIIDEEPMEAWLSLAIAHQEAAAQAAADAAQSAEDAADSAEDAEGFADDAELHAQEAQGYAADAEGYAEQAGQYASLALLAGGEIAFKMEDGHVILYYTDNIEPLVNGMEHLGT